MPAPVDRVVQALERLDEAKTGYLEGKSGSIEAITTAAQAILTETHESKNPTAAHVPEEEKPSDFLQRVFWAESALSPILVVAVQLNLFQRLRIAGDAGVSSNELCSDASGTGARSKQQLERILRHLASTKVIAIKSAGTWLRTALSDELAAPQFQHSILFCHYVTRQAFNGFPEYFDRLLRHEEDAGESVELPGPFQIGLKTSLPFFDYLGANPPNGMFFNYFMQAYRAGNAMWFDSYPVADRLVKGFEPSHNEVFLLDLGGGKGHDLSAFAAKFPELPGKLVLQDQSSVIAEIQIPEGEDHPFEYQAHDFFTPQPIKAARAYFLHSILHDWGDADCRRILENLKPALERGYSKVLFNEIVLSEERPTVAATNMDVMMLGHLDPAYERTESAWKRLLESAGYSVVAIIGVEGAAESVIEAEVN